MIGTSVLKELKEPLDCLVHLVVLQLVWNEYQFIDFIIYLTILWIQSQFIR